MAKPIVSSSRKNNRRRLQRDEGAYNPVPMRLELPTVVRPNNAAMVLWLQRDNICIGSAIMSSWQLL